MSLFTPLLALVAAGCAGLLALILSGSDAAVAAAIVVFVGLLGAAAAGGAWRGLGIGVSLVLVAGVVALGGYHAWQVGSVLAATNEPPEPPDPVHLEQALARGEEVITAGGGPFTLELTEQEITALAQEALARRDGHPVRAVEFTTSAGDPGHLDFTAWFKGGSATANGRLALAVEDGRLTADLADASFGAIPVPGMAHSAFDEVAAAVGTLNESLDAGGVWLDQVTVADGVVVISGG